VLRRTAASLALLAWPSTATVDLVYMNTSEGAALIKGASHDRPYWQVAPVFTTELPGMCGPTTAVMLLNALASQGLSRPLSREFSASFGGRVFPSYYWDQENVWNGSAAPCVAAGTQPYKGSLEQVGAFLSCRGLEVQAVRAANSSTDEFRAAMVQAFEHSPLRFVAVNFARPLLGQAGLGHHSPIGAYDRASDRALVMDVARYKYAPAWVRVPDLFEAMLGDVSPKSNFSTPRGYLVVGMPPGPSQAVLLT